MQYLAKTQSRRVTSTMLAVFLTCLVVYSLFFSGRHYSIDGVVMFQQAKIWFAYRL